MHHAAIFAQSNFCSIQFLHDPLSAQSIFCTIHFLLNCILYAKEPALSKKYSLISKLKANNRSHFVGSGWHREGGGEKMASGERIDGLKEAQVCQCPANDHLILVHGFVNNASCCWSRFFIFSGPNSGCDLRVINKNRINYDSSHMCI